VAAQPRPMAHTDFGDAQTLLASARQHFRVHEEPAACGENLGQRLAPKDLQGTVDVANRGAEQGPRQQVVAARIKLAQPRILAIDAIADRDRMLVGELNERTEVGKEELAIGVGEGDALAARGTLTFAVER